MVSRCLMICSLLIVSAALSSPAQAKVPQHLASMAADLYSRTNVELSSKGESDLKRSPAERNAAIRAKSIIRRAGVRYWASSVLIRENAAEPLADALGLDLNDEQDWLLLQSLVKVPYQDKQEHLRKILEKQDRATDQQKLNEALAKFDAAQTKALEDLEKQHTLNISSTESVSIQWRPGSNKLDVVIEGFIDDDREEGAFQVVLSGQVVIRPTTEGNHLRLYTYPNDPGVVVITEEKLQKIRGSVFGKWEDQEGRLWEITKADGSIPARQDSASQDKQIKKLNEQIKELKNQKVYVWKHQKTGEIVRQEKFKKLGEAYEYQGEQMAGSDSAKKIKEKESQIAALREEGKLLPVDAHDPLNEADLALDDPQALIIKVTDKDGYNYIYRRAYFDGTHIKADRTLADIRDITVLPDPVVKQLIASWSPPEWVEVQARLASPSSPQIVLDGSRFRLHVTYEAPFFGIGDYTVKRIHTPYPNPLFLTKSGILYAQGAEKDTQL